MQEADNYPEMGGGARSPRDVAWVLGVGVAPVLALVLAIPAVAVLERRGVVLSNVIGDWNLYAVFGLTVFAPIMVISCIGALVMISNFHVGRWISSMGMAATILCTIVLTCAAVADAITPTPRGDTDNWISTITPSGTALFVVPYLALSGLNVYTIVRLWRARF